MCGRYTGNDDTEEMSYIYRMVKEHYPSIEMKHGDIFPTDTAPILYGNEMLAVPARFGFPSPKGKGVIINARVETAAEKNMFKESLLLRRCIVPTTGYIEWDRDKTKYKINSSDSDMLYLGGFCKRFDDVGHFVILTTEPNTSVSGIHNRMPLIISPNKEDMIRWNCDTEWAMNLLKREMPALSCEVI